MNKKIVRVVAHCKDHQEADDPRRAELDGIRERAGVLPLLAQRFDSAREAEPVRQQIEAALREASPADLKWTVTVVTGEHGQRDGATLR